MDSIVVKGFPNCSKHNHRRMCSCITTEDKANTCVIDVSAIPQRLGNLNAFVYNAAVRSDPVCGKKLDDKDCKCFPVKPKPPCTTTDCVCLAHDMEAYSRRIHKSFCPSYKHKETCPVTNLNDEETADVGAEEEVELLPHGLPPIKVGPCPVPGRPCSGPDGMTRIFKNFALPPQPPPANIVGKISCSKEYERIKKAMDDFLKDQEKPEFLCINTFQVDTERRCCDVEQKLLNLLGKSCCAEHKLASMAIFKEKSEREASEKRNA